MSNIRILLLVLKSWVVTQIRFYLTISYMLITIITIKFGCDRDLSSLVNSQINLKLWFNLKF